MCITLASNVRCIQRHTPRHLHTWYRRHWKQGSHLQRNPRPLTLVNVATGRHQAHSHAHHTTPLALLCLCLYSHKTSSRTYSQSPLERGPKNSLAAPVAVVSPSTSSMSHGVVNPTPGIPLENLRGCCAGSTHAQHVQRSRHDRERRRPFQGCTKHASRLGPVYQCCLANTCARFLRNYSCPSDA